MLPLLLHRATLLTVAATYLCICVSVVVNAPVDTASSQDQLYPDAAALEQQLIQQSGEDRSAATREQAKPQDSSTEEKEEQSLDMTKIQSSESDESLDEDEGLDGGDVHQVDERARLFDVPEADSHEGGDTTEEDSESCYACQQKKEDDSDSSEQAGDVISDVSTSDDSADAEDEDDDKQRLPREKKNA